MIYFFGNGLMVQYICNFLVQLVTIAAYSSPVLVSAGYWIAFTHIFYGQPYLKGWFKHNIIFCGFLKSLDLGTEKHIKYMVVP